MTSYLNFTEWQRYGQCCLIGCKGKYQRSRRVVQESGRGTGQARFSIKLCLSSSPWVSELSMGEGCSSKVGQNPEPAHSPQETLGRTLLGVKIRSNSSSETAPAPRKLIGSWLSARSLRVPHAKVNIRRLLNHTREIAVDTDTGLRELGTAQSTEVDWKKMELVPEMMLSQNWCL